VARQRTFEVALAVQVYIREHGEYPDSVEQVVGHGLEDVPIDPFGIGESIRYRKEPIATDGATIWSVGPDGIDDGAQQRFPSRENRVDDRGDIVRRVLPPRKLEVTE
jgi:hypothetical protein